MEISKQVLIGHLEWHFRMNGNDDISCQVEIITMISWGNEYKVDYNFEWYQIDFKSRCRITIEKSLLETFYVLI